MKKRLFVIAVLSICALMVMTVGGCSCNGGRKPKNEHLEHIWSAWERVNDPDCENEGLESRHCEGCDKTETRPVDALGHSFGDLHERVEAQCEAAGQVAYYECETCHKKYDESQKNELSGEALEIKPLGHTFGDLQEKVEAQCETAGHVAYYECQTCHKKYDESQQNEIKDENLVIEAKGHSYGQLIQQKDATCEAAGMKAHYQCADCHKYFDDKQAPTNENDLVINATGHNFGKLHEKIEAQCEAAGQVAYYECETCHKKYDESQKNELSDEALEIKPLGHTFGDLHERVEAQCETAGHVAYYECQTCHKKYDESQQNEIKDENLVIEAKGHSYGQLIPQKDATCEAAGMRAHYQCADCQKYFDDKQAPTDENDLVINATGHNFGELHEKIEPKCEETGKVEYYECQTCHKKYDKSQQNEIKDADLVIKAKGHSYGQLIPQKDATCEATGMKAHYQCADCRKYFDDNQVPTEESALVIEKKEHNYGELIPQKEATCEEAGMRAHYKCENCGNYLDDQRQPTTENELTIQKKNHNLGQLISQRDATCEETGMRAHYKCANCQKYFDEHQAPTEESALVIEATGHSFGALNKRVEAQCETAGHVAYYECGKCNKKYDEDQENELSDEEWEIKPLGHTFGELQQRVEAQCETAGHVAYFECNVCHKKYDEHKDKALSNEDVVIKATGHKFGDLNKKIEAQCETDGRVAYYECNVCHKKYDENQREELSDKELVIEKKGHSYGELIPFKDATCEDKGMMAHYQCANCQKYFDEHQDPTDESALEIKAKGHSFGELHAKVEPRCEVAGKEEYYECETCHKKYDKSKKQQLSDDQLEIKALEHSFETKHNQTQHYSQCKLCSVTRDYENHNSEIEDYECSKCGWHFEYTQSLTFKKEGEGYTVTGATNDKLTKIVIPDTYSGQPVLKIGNNAFCSKDINTPKPIVNVSFGKNIVEIGMNAFWNCIHLQNVEFPSGLKIIGGYAFERCSSITSLKLGPALQRLDIEAFWGCTSIRGNIDFPESLNYVGKWAFSGCSGIESISFSADVTIIESAFYGCTSMTTATFNGNVTTGDYIFCNCSGLTTLTFNGNVTTGNYIFNNCTSIRSLTFGDGDITLGYNLFYSDQEIYSLEQVTFGKGNKDIDAWVFYGNKLSSIDFGDGNVTLAQYAIVSCSSLGTVRFGDGKITLAEDAFYYCSGLESVSFGDGDPSISQNAFYECPALTTLEFGDGEHLFEQYALSNCDALTTLRFGKGTTRIDEYVINRNSIEELSFGGGNVTIGANAFSYTPLKRLILGEGTYDIGEEAFASCKQLVSLSFPDGKITLAKSAFEQCEALTTVKFGNGEKSIASSVFFHCPVSSIILGDGNLTVAKYGFSWLDELTSVTFGNGSVFLDEQAFYDCDLLSSVVFLGEATIGDRAFTGCPALNSVRFENGNINLVDYAFSGCSGLKTVYIGDGKTIIGDDCFYSSGSDTFEKAGGSIDIGEYAFHGTNIRSVVINCECTIALRAFQDCAKLTTVELNGKVISIGFESFANCTSLTKFSISDDIGEINSGAFIGTQGIGLINYNDAEYLGNEENSYAVLMRGTNKSATTISIHPNTRVICGKAFSGFTLLEDITIPAGVVQIGDYAFEGCKALTSITIPQGVKKIGNSAFRDCEALETVTIEGGDKQIREFAFENCNALKRVNVADISTWLSLRFEGTQRVGSTNPLYYEATLYVGGNELTELVIPDEISEISALAFAGYDKLTSVKLGSGLKSIDPSSFFWCKGLVSITGSNDHFLTENNCILEASSKKVVLGCAGSTIPSDAKAIGEYAFYGVKFNNTSITLSDTLAEIAEHAFYASNITNLTVGGGLKSIGSQAFGAVSLNELHINNLKVWCGIDFADSGSVAIDYCIIYVNGTRVTHNQNVLTIPEDVTEIKDYAFWHSQITTLHISSKTVKISNKAFAASPSLNNITIEDGNPVYKVLGCGLYDINTKTLVIGTLAKNTNSAVISDEVEYIAPYAFMNRLVKSLTLSSSVKEIGEYAFYQCRIAGTITITSKVTKIGDSAFAHNTDATKVVIPAAVTYIGKDAFYQTGLTSAEFAVTEGWGIKHYFFGTTMTPDFTNAGATAEQLIKSGYVWTR